MAMPFMLLCIICLPMLACSSRSSSSITAFRLVDGSMRQNTYDMDMNLSCDVRVRAFRSSATDPRNANMAAEPRFISVADEAVTRTEQQYHRQQDQMIETLGRHRARNGKSRSLDTMLRYIEGRRSICATRPASSTWRCSEKSCSGTLASSSCRKVMLEFAKDLDALGIAEIEQKSEHDGAQPAADHYLFWGSCFKKISAWRARGTRPQRRAYLAGVNDQTHESLQWNLKSHKDDEDLS
eukprot:CAMPEP_0204091642 /NCGR_PEP_ID=MMETSP0360-20130528/189505_1 /ASSEMBLY_ACC=CAM_ASM_000342 /TAXON_ID=268821 /ORGANISM="Scrippsiella Hangoei, Strain SHTV-5" /LENGTH=238 /DNA_ID=CAMNT_0051040907 /DNA_START=563 /DNA_END=1279 /DNA_ORIENTATION=-